METLFKTRVTELYGIKLPVIASGQGVVFADRIEPLAAIVDRIEQEARAALERLDRLRIAPQVTALKTQRA